MVKAVIGRGINMVMFIPLLDKPVMRVISEMNKTQASMLE